MTQGNNSSASTVRGTGALLRRDWSTIECPQPSGSYSQAVSVGGMLYVSGQTARLADGSRLIDEPFDVQARTALNNVEKIARSAGSQLAEAAMVTVFLVDPRAQSAQFDQIYREFLAEDTPFPARAIVESQLPYGQIEITAVIPLNL